jgi:hypothetical protein
MVATFATLLLAPAPGEIETTSADNRLEQGSADCFASFFLDGYTETLNLIFATAGAGA